MLTWRHKILRLYIADEMSLNSIFIELTLFVENGIGNSIDVGNAYLTIAVHVTIGLIVAREYHVNHGIDVGDAHLTITVHVTRQNGNRIKVQLVVHPCDTVGNPLLEPDHLIGIIAGHIVIGPDPDAPAWPSLAVALFGTM